MRVFDEPRPGVEPATFLSVDFSLGASSGLRCVCSGRDAGCFGVARCVGYNGLRDCETSIGESNVFDFRNGTARNGEGDGEG